LESEKGKLSSLDQGVLESPQRHETLASSTDAEYERFYSMPDISRVEVAAAARRRAMKLYYGTANGPQRSGCCQIGSPAG
jgi:hypothetical protein